MRIRARTRNIESALDVVSNPLKRLSSLGIRKSEQARAAVLAELPSSASFYSLRHSCISCACEAGMPLNLIAENAETTVRMNAKKNYGKFREARTLTGNRFWGRFRD